MPAVPIRSGDAACVLLGVLFFFENSKFFVCYFFLKMVYWAATLELVYWDAS